MKYLELAFQLISIIFAAAAVYTGLKAVLNPVAFSESFGLPINTPKSAKDDKATSQDHLRAKSYASLMGVRQLATGLTLMVFGYQGKWTEIATILAIIGILVAGTDGYHLASSGQKGLGMFHAIPGALIAILAGTRLWFSG